MFRPDAQLGLARKHGIMTQQPISRVLNPEQTFSELRQW